ncbi:protein NO VEIN domain-containing protein [Nocardioides solisilvae]|uniref:protein NO VEIN domain-containing protein n=1 Tax=Nocardioides solisilvae TaxID=1542435 RepID=UPI001EF4B9F9|nr:DUF3883 domain-containing protein [Nocardioides solisilvae]
MPPLLTSHGYELDFDEVYFLMWHAASGDEDGTRLYVSSGEEALKWLIAELAGTPAESGVTLPANDALRSQVHELLEAEGWAERLGTRTFRLLREPNIKEDEVATKHVLLTWNPGRDNDAQYTPRQWDDFVADVSRRPVEGRWSVGRRRHGIREGDVAYLLRQGTHGTGVLASGTILGSPVPGEHWRDPGAVAQYVDVAWDRAVRMDDMLTTDVLEQEVPEFPWKQVYFSGREVTGASGDLLQQVWNRHSARHEQGEDPTPETGRSASSIDEAEVTITLDNRGRPVGAGFGSAEQNKRVETAAVRHVEEAYEREGWDVEDVSTQKIGWDLTATRGSEIHHLEVKGVSGTLTQCFVTANELRAAEEDPAWRLVIVTSALDAPTLHDVDPSVAIHYATPTIFRVNIPAEEFD